MASLLLHSFIKLTLTGCKMNRDPKKKPEQKQPLPSTTCREPPGRTTKGPVHERRSALRLLKGRLSTGGEAGSEIPATLWSNLSVETTHLSRGSYSTGQSHGSAVSSPSNGRESVVRGLPRRFSEMSKGPPSEMIGVQCQRCQADAAAFRVVTDAIDIHVCPSCAEEARLLELATEGLPNADPKNDRP